MHLEHQRELAGAGAFAGDEAEILQRVLEHRSDVLLDVDHAGARPQLALPERGAWRCNIGGLKVHPFLLCLLGTSASGCGSPNL
jgi:hypothetical protein